MSGIFAFIFNFDKSKNFLYNIYKIKEIESRKKNDY